MADDDLEMDMDEDFLDDDPIPARRDTRIFNRKKDGSDDSSKKNDDFEEDVFV